MKTIDQYLAEFKGTHDCTEDGNYLFDDIKSYFEQALIEARNDTLDEAIAIIEEEDEDKYGWMDNYDLQIILAKEVVKLKKWNTKNLKSQGVLFARL